MWFSLKGDERLGRCASEGCGGQPTYRLEADGVGSNYCSGCKEKIVHQDVAGCALWACQEADSCQFPNRDGSCSY